ncbi:MAG: hypothetical protein ACK4EY_12590 [Flavipsychrobacter sp.]
MEDFEGHITHAGTDYEVNISPVYNEVLDEVNYAVSYAGASSFLLAWENSENPGFKIQGAAPYVAYEMKEAISIVIEHHYT